MVFSARKLALMGLLIALAIALKLPILPVPNVEFFTFIVFSSGFLLGMMEGVLVGLISMSVYTTMVTPYGLPPLPIACAQVFSMGLIGFAGGLARGLGPARREQGSTSRPLSLVLVIGAFGLVLTVVYDLLTNLAVAFVMGQFLPVMLAAIPFALLHVVSNVIIFAALSPALLGMSGTRLR